MAQKSGEKCSLCGTKIGPIGCCSEIRKLSRQVEVAARIARKAREILLKQDIKSLEEAYIILRDLT